MDYSSPPTKPYFKRVIPGLGDTEHKGPEPIDLRAMGGSQHDPCVPAGWGWKGTRFIVLSLDYQGSLGIKRKGKCLQTGLMKPLKGGRFAQVFAYNGL